MSDRQRTDSKTGIAYSATEVIHTTDLNHNISKAVTGKPNASVNDEYGYTDNRIFVAGYADNNWVFPRQFIIASSVDSEGKVLSVGTSGVIGDNEKISINKNYFEKHAHSSAGWADQPEIERKKKTADFVKPE